MLINVKEYEPYKGHNETIIISVMKYRKHKISKIKLSLK